MKRLLTRTSAILMAVMVMVTAAAVPGKSVKADSVSEKPYLALGADLNEKERDTVLSLLDVDKDDLDDYKVVQITNEEEHHYLDSYLDRSVIGSRALSSVLVEREDSGEGIEVKTHNITYCTKGMYVNALTTAGITDASVVVAGPFDITGTAALVGAMKAYEEMTGTDISAEQEDAATNELVITGRLAEDMEDSEKAEEFLAGIKEDVLSEDVQDTQDILDIIDEKSQEMDVELTEDQKQQIADLMEKINGLDLNINDVKKQASEIYDRLSEIDVDGQGIFEKISTALRSFFGAIRELVK